MIPFCAEHSFLSPEIRHSIELKLHGQVEAGCIIKIHSDQMIHLGEYILVYCIPDVSLFDFLSVVKIFNRGRYLVHF